MSSFEENLDKTAFASPAEYAKANATLKAAAVVAELAEGASEAASSDTGARVTSRDLVIGSDTVVVVDGRILEKPRSEAAAFGMLSTLRYVQCSSNCWVAC